MSIGMGKEFPVDGRFDQEPVSKQVITLTPEDLARAQERVNFLRGYKRGCRLAKGPSGFFEVQDAVFGAYEQSRRGRPYGKGLLEGVGDVCAKNYRLTGSYEFKAAALRYFEMSGLSPRQLEEKLKLISVANL